MDFDGLWADPATDPRMAIDYGRGEKAELTADQLATRAILRPRCHRWGDPHEAQVGAQAGRSARNSAQLMS